MTLKVKIVPVHQEPSVFVSPLSLSDRDNIAVHYINTSLSLSLSVSLSQAIIATQTVAAE